ncbi:MAG TPA: SRPBCC family protein [Acidimicrobiales bacterium]|nr:SRPBCC family protein [Acidimicrobiales bacterium]
MQWPGVIDTWGSSDEERDATYPCDALIGHPDRVLFRAVDVAAPAELVFRWLCQLRLAPYSYDWIDNLGRRSPRQLTPGLDRLEVGQPIATVFRLASFEEGRSITFDGDSWLLGRVAMTYRAVPVGAGAEAGTGTCRLVVKLAVAWPPGPLGPVMRAVLPPGDLVMMRRQLLNLKALAERDARLDGRGADDRASAPRPTIG